MTGTIVRLPEKHFIGMSFSGSFQTLIAGMPGHWGDFLMRQDEIAQVIEPNVRYDISDENRSFQMHTEYVAVEVERFAHIPQKMVGFTIPARTYAKFTHVGPMTQVQITYTQLFQWLHAQGLQMDESALRLERYDERYIPSMHAADRVENTYEIFIPLLDK